MENFRCYYCAFKTNYVDNLLEHITILHENENLKYREASLDEVTGKFSYVTKIHQIEGVVIIMIVDCIDKQNVALARRVFAEDVQASMLPEFKKEAAFCEMIRQWFEAEDEPGIDPTERCRRRIVLRDWLLEEYNCNNFPHPRAMFVAYHEYHLKHF